MNNRTVRNYAFIYILTLSSDGPTINIVIGHYSEQSLKASGNPGVIDIGTCNLRIVHKSFCTALESYCSPLDDLAMDIPFIIPPAYEVYRGYIVFAFSVCDCVCVFVNFFLSKISRKLHDLGF